MRILGIETSCDETGAAVIEGTDINQPVKLLSNSLATSLASHAITGGIIPENAAREQIKFIIPVIKESIQKAGLNFKRPEIDAIAVTYGPGLIGSLLVGVETAKTLSMLWNIPIIPVNHLYGHIYANWITTDNIEHKVNSKNDKKPSALSLKPNTWIEFPALALVVSGGHTDLVLIKNHGELIVLGGTRDDAAGEAFDKIGRLLSLPYPAGPLISKLADKGDPKTYNLPRPMWDSKDYDFSFSGLKTSVLNLIKKNNWVFDNHLNVDKANEYGNSKLIVNLCASVQEAIIDVLVFKTMKAVTEFEVKSLILGGGVAANTALREEFQNRSSVKGVNLYVPSVKLCTDNGAMIASAGFYNRNFKSWAEVTADPELYY